MCTVDSMQDIALASRENISDAIATTLREMILDGALPDGTRINEVHLARDIGVSRTPLREALRQLAAEGFLVARPRRGYFVRPLTLDEFEQVYAIRPVLDPEALRLAGLPSGRRIEALARMNQTLAEAADPAARVRIDDAWHLELLGACPNRILIELIENMIVRTRRYELALMREAPNVDRATEDHERILAALRHKDLELACAALKANMQSGWEPIAQWLRGRTPPLSAV